MGVMSRSISCPSIVVSLEAHQGKDELSGRAQSRNDKTQNVHIGHVERNIGNYTEKRRHRLEHRLCPANCCRKKLVSIDNWALAWDGCPCTRFRGGSRMNKTCAQIYIRSGICGSSRRKNDMHCLSRAEKAASVEVSWNTRRLPSCKPASVTIHKRREALRRSCISQQCNPCPSCCSI